MEPIFYVFIALTGGVFTGLGISWALQRTRQKQLQKKAALTIKEAHAEADRIRKERALQIKEETIQLKAAREAELGQLDRQIRELELRHREEKQSLEEKAQKLEKQEVEQARSREQLEKQMELVQARTQELNELKDQQVRQLEKVAGLSAEEARNKMVEALKDEARTASMSYVKEIMDQARESAVKGARKLIIETVQRVASETTIENSVSVFHLESDDLKGKIIGREGRNIRTLEAATGVELVVDDTPEAIIISGFDPVRREIARLSLQKLVADGRIHPARIEEVVEKTKSHINEEIKEIGERTVIDLGIHGLHPELVRMVGRMRFRSSYGQNLLQHSREVANFCAVMSAELGLDTKLAKRAGLLHDIGKVAEEDSDQPHALLGMELARKFGEHPDVCNAIGAHHDEIEMNCLIAPVIQSCDAISGARPGARREVVESYIKRLRELEELGLSYSGVEKAFAIQAGRELRVVVESDKITDVQAEELAQNISKRIEGEMVYPGQVRVTVIRETRSVAIAR